MKSLSKSVAVLALATLAALPGCRKEAELPVAPPVVNEPVAPPPDRGPVELKDTIETDPRYIIGISYPPAVNRYPGLASALREYSDAARAELMDAVAALDDEQPTTPYDLALSYTLVAETPSVVAVAGDGSSYTGGAHGTPLVARFVWLPRRQELLRAEALVAGPRGWQAISEHVREQLHAALSQRVDADKLDPAERAEVVRSAGRLIDDGSEADPANFAQFEPVLDAEGRLRALRFVFPPYQVGPYSDGVQTVEVPASVLMPHLAADYRDLFAEA
jgi:hypothetical protein